VDSAGGDHAYFCHCNDCGVCQDYDNKWSRDDAIAAWNRRPTLPADTEVVQRAKAYLASQTIDKTLHPSHPDVIINDLVQAVEAGLEDAGEVVAWRVKDFADGWILRHTEAAAKIEAEGAGNLIQPLVTQASYLTLSAKVRALEEERDEARKHRDSALAGLDAEGKAHWAAHDRAEAAEQKVKALEARKPVYIAVDYTGVEHIREDRHDAVAIAKHNLASAIETATRDAEQANARLLRENAELEEERLGLISAVGDHITVRSEYLARAEAAEQYKARLVAALEFYADPESYADARRALAEAKKP